MRISCAWPEAPWKSLSMTKYDEFFSNLSDGRVITKPYLTFTLDEERIGGKSVPHIVAMSLTKKLYVGFTIG